MDTHEQVGGKGAAGLAGLEELAKGMHLDVGRGGEGHGAGDAGRGRDAQVLVPLEAVAEQAVDRAVVIVGVGSQRLQGKAEPSLPPGH